METSEPTRVGTRETEKISPAHKKRKVSKRKLLFIYLGTRIVEFNVTVDEEYVTTIFHWYSMVKEDVTLRKASDMSYKLIKRDLQSIERYFKCKEKDLQNGQFVSDNDKKFFVYSYPKSIAYSNANLSYFAPIADIEEKAKFVPPCEILECHSTYLPYFCSNDQCRYTFGLHGFTDEHPFHDLLRGMSEEKAGNLKENDWTKRLHHCFCSKKIGSQYTAETSADEVNNLNKLLPEFRTAKVLLFRGAPDIILSVEKQPGESGLVTCTGGIQDHDDSDSCSSEDDSPDELARMQMGHQMATKTYVPTSFQPEKVGELVASMHSALCCKALRRYKTKTEFNCLQAHGLFVHRALGLIYVAVTLSKTCRMKIYSELLYSGVVPTTYLCSTIKHFIDILQKT